MSLSGHVSDLNVIAEGIEGGKTKEAVMTDILDAQAKEKEDARKAAVEALAKAAKESGESVVAQGTLANDGLVTDEAKAKERIDQMCKNMEGAK